MKTTRREASDFPAGAGIFMRMYTRLGCVGRPPQFRAEFYPYASFSHTIRLRGETAQVRLSDVLRQAPLGVLEATAALLLSRVFPRPLPDNLRAAYRAYVESPRTRRRLHRLRHLRGRRVHTGPQGKFHHLGEIFARVNADYFRARLAAPEIGWSARAWLRQLGVFDPGLGHIVINRGLDRETVPDVVVAYVVFHEMLHLARATGRSRCGLGAHSPEFRREEKRFRDYAQARRLLAKI